MIAEAVVAPRKPNIMTTTTLLPAQSKDARQTITLSLRIKLTTNMAAADPLNAWNLPSDNCPGPEKVSMKLASDNAKTPLDIVNMKSDMNNMTMLTLDCNPFRLKAIHIHQSTEYETCRARTIVYVVMTMRATYIP